MAPANHALLHDASGPRLAGKWLDTCENSHGFYRSLGICTNIAGCDAWLPHHRGSRRVRQTTWVVASKVTKWWLSWCLLMLIEDLPHKLGVVFFFKSPELSVSSRPQCLRVVKVKFVGEGHMVFIATRRFRTHGCDTDCPNLELSKNCTPFWRIFYCLWFFHLWYAPQNIASLLSNMWYAPHNICNIYNIYEYM